MSTEVYNITNTDFYKSLESFGVFDSRYVGWNTKESQSKRFKILDSLGMDDNTTFLDVGCGIGGIIPYLKSRGLKNYNYIGIDIEDRFINDAKSLYNNYNFININFLDYNPNINFDYIFGSGLFTIDFNIELLSLYIKKAFDMCNKAICFNFIENGFIDNPPKYFNTFDKEMLFNKFTNEYGKHSTVLVDRYLPCEDFSIIIRKYG